MGRKTREYNLGNNFVNLYPQYDFKKTDDSVSSNPFVKNHLNSAANYKKLHRDLNKIQSGVDVFIKTINNAEKKISNNPLQMFFTGLMSIFPASRRLVPIENNEKDHNRFKAVGLGLLALINLKEDIRDLLSVFGKTKNELDKEYKAVFKFFAGTPVETLLKRSELGKRLYQNFDTNLGDGIFAEKVLTKFGLEQDSILARKKVYYPFVREPEIIFRKYRKFSGSFIAKISMLTLNRITKLGLVFVAMLELPKIIDEAKNGNYRQIPKSFTNVISYALFGALVSSIGAYTLGSAGSVLGLGLGYYVANNVSKLINKKY